MVVDGGGLIRLHLSLVCYLLFFFFFQAEDGIRDLIVTGVQTCALAISPLNGPWRRAAKGVRPSPRSMPQARSWRRRPGCTRSRRVSGEGAPTRSCAWSRDRKSVVEGKSVDLGGRRIIKKKKKKQC